MWLTHAHLKARQRAERHQQAESIALRIHRSLSWLLGLELCNAHRLWGDACYPVR